MKTFLFPAACLLLLAAGCGGSRVVDARKSIEKVSRFEFDELERYNLALSVVGKTAFASGDPAAVLTFQLRNLDNAPVSLPDWKAYEYDNIILHMRQCRPDETPEEAARAEWFTPGFYQDENPQYVPFQLLPGTFVTLYYPFEPAIMAPEDLGAWFKVWAELNLDTVKVRTPEFTVRVVPGDQMQNLEESHDFEYQF